MWNFNKQTRLSFNNRILVPLVALVVIAVFLLVRGSHATNTMAPTVLSAYDPAASSPGTTASSNSQPAQPAKPDCGDCWVHVFDDKGFDVTDDHQLICGPGKWPSLRHLAGATIIDWDDEIESLRVGPGAVVTVWTGEQFTGQSYTFPAGTEKIDLKDLLGFSENISSIEIKRP